MNGAEWGAGGGGGGAVSLCSLRVGEGMYGIDTRQVREVLGKATPQRVPLAPGYVAGVVPYRGEVLTAVSFRALLGLGRGTGKGCVLVLEDEENGERFGLMVDGVGGVTMAAASAREENPSSLDSRSVALFDGAYRLEAGLLVNLDTRRLRPSRLAESGLFEDAGQETGRERVGEQRWGRAGEQR